MRTLLSIPMLAILALAGCQTHPQVSAHIDTVNAEYRQLEDYVYCLEDEVSRLQLELDAVKTGRVSERAVPSRGDRSPSRPRPDSTPRSGAGGAEDAPQIDVPGSGQRPDLAPPDIDLPPPGAIPRPPERIRPAAAEAPLAAKPEKPSDTKITHITLSPVLTGGSDFDSQPGDDGLCIVVEPRNAGEEYVPEAGPISIVVLDPAKQGDAARVARWDFDLSAARQKLSASAATTGLKLELPWPATPPAANRLHVFVRYETADGRKLQTDREIFLTPPGQISNRWTPRTVERQRPITDIKPASSTADATSSEMNPASAASSEPPMPPASLSAGEAAPQTSRPTWSPHR